MVVKRSELDRIDFSDIDTGEQIASEIEPLSTARRPKLARTHARAAAQALSFNANAARVFRAASTIAVRAGSICSQSRVFRPQSGFTHNRSGEIRWSARPIRAAISSAVDTRGAFVTRPQIELLRPGARLQSQKHGKDAANG